MSPPKKPLCVEIAAFRRRTQGEFAQLKAATQIAIAESRKALTQLPSDLPTDFLPDHEDRRKALI